MNLLVDSCAGRRLARALAETGYAVDFAGEWQRDPGDRDILQAAFAAGRVVITRDKDFGTLAVLQGLPHLGIVRLVEQPPQAELAACLAALERHGAELAAGGMVTVEPGRVRIRRAGSDLRPGPPA